MENELINIIYLEKNADNAGTDVEFTIPVTTKSGFTEENVHRYINELKEEYPDENIYKIMDHFAEMFWTNPAHADISSRKIFHFDMTREEIIQTVNNKRRLAKQLDIVADELGLMEKGYEDIDMNSLYIHNDTVHIEIHDWEHHYDFIEEKFPLIFLYDENAREEYIAQKKRKHVLQD